MGSQNGGGKSTLLQLIFVLLRCSTSPEAGEIFGNLFKRFSIPEGSEKREIATIEIIGNDREKIKLNFFAASKNFVKNEAEACMEKYRHSIDDSARQEIEDIEEFIGNLIYHVQASNNNIDCHDIDYMDYTSLKNSTGFHLGNDIKKLLLRSNILLLSTYSWTGKPVNEHAFIICEIDVETVQPDKIKNLRLVLSEISSNVFLAAPSTQIFLFMSPESRKKLLDKYMKERDNTQYTDDLQYMKDTISNFFTYDFLPVNTLISLFEKARDEDFAQVVKTGNYGSSYNELLEKMNAVLGEKRINARDDLSGMQFFLGENGSSTEIYPEDLSHGELKRFGICIWLMASKIKNSIVLMDEIELALHPDWQYQIVRDLVDWGPDNQYILATHSYSLCEALTPAHVKEIPPLLLSHA